MSGSSSPLGSSPIAAAVAAPHGDNFVPATHPQPVSQGGSGGGGDGVDPTLRRAIRRLDGTSSRGGSGEYAPAGRVRLDAEAPAQSTFGDRVAKSHRVIIALLLLVAGAAIFGVVDAHHGNICTDAMKSHVIEPILNNDALLAGVAVVAAVASYYIVKKLLSGMDYLVLNGRGSRAAEKAGEWWKDAGQWKDAQQERLERACKYYTEVKDSNNPTFSERLRENKGKIAFAVAIVFIALGFAGYYGAHDSGLKEFWDKKVAGFQSDVLNPIMANKLYIALASIGAAYIAYRGTKYVFKRLDYILFNDAVSKAYWNYCFEIAKTSSRPRPVEVQAPEAGAVDGSSALDQPNDDKKTSF